jgi:hypothetical protein
LKNKNKWKKLKNRGASQLSTDSVRHLTWIYRIKNERLSLKKRRRREKKRKDKGSCRNKKRKEIGSGKRLKCSKDLKITKKVRMH